MYKTGLTKKGETSDSSETDMTKIEYQQFQCGSCGFIEGRAIAAFTDKLGILASKNDRHVKRNVVSKGNAKKMKDMSKPRRQEPR